MRINGIEINVQINSDTIGLEENKILAAFKSQRGQSQSKDGCDEPSAAPVWTLRELGVAVGTEEKKIGGDSGFGEGPEFFYMCETSTLKSRCCFGIISSS